jgi:hypothetical protein
LPWGIGAAREEATIHPQQSDHVTIGKVSLKRGTRVGDGALALTVHRPAGAGSRYAVDMNGDTVDATVRISAGDGEVVEARIRIRRTDSVVSTEVRDVVSLP